MSIRIIIADDHAVFRSGLRALLEKEEDFVVAGEVGTGDEAVAIVDEQEFDILLLDISMPGLKGPRVAEQVLVERPDLGIVVLTMHEDEHYFRELMSIGARGYLLKKSTGTELVQAIRSVHRGDSYIDSSLADLALSRYLGIPTKEKSSPLDVLTPREQEVCRHVALGFTNSEIAEKLFISVRTVETHRTNIMGKLGIETRAKLVRFAIENGLLQQE